MGTSDETERTGNTEHCSPYGHDRSFELAAKKALFQKVPDKLCLPVDQQSESVMFFILLVARAEAARES